MDGFEELYALLKGSGGGGGGSSSGGYIATVATAANLPASGSKGDMYFVSGEGIFYVYDSGWKAIRETAITTAQIDALWP